MLSVTPSGNVTLEDIAARAGVSISTASRSLTGAARVSKHAQARVLTAAKELGYRYNPLLGEVMRAARRGAPNHYLGTLAYITPCEDVQEWRATPTLCRHWSAARDQAARFGFGVSEFALGAHSMSARRLGDILRARGISGILLAAFPNEPFELVLPWEHFVTVPVGHMIQNPQLDCVVSDHTQAVLLSGRVLAERGYRRIGLAMESYQNAITNHGWVNGYAALPTENPKLAGIPPYLPEKMTEGGFMAWVRAHEVDCVLTLSTFRNAANPMSAWLASGGFDCPRDVGLVSLDVTAAASSWAGIDQNSDEIGRAAIDLVLSKVRAGECGIPRVRRSLLVHCQWRDGDTVRVGRDVQRCA